MIHYRLMPLEQTFDSGFGALGDAFHEAAERLFGDEELGSLFNRRLPVCFLYRHSIELYLKSAVTILHRRFRLPNPSDKHEPMPVVKVGEKWRPIHAVHGIHTLYEHLCVLLAMLNEGLGKLMSTPIDFPSQMNDWIKTVDQSDAGSTYFRYPVTREASGDGVKSSMKPVDPQVLQQKTHDDPSNVHAFVLVDEDGEAVEAFADDKQVLETTLDALQNAAQTLRNVHAHMRAELTGGY